MARYYRRYWRPRWRKRYRWFRTWRTGAPFRRRRRRRRRVRRKLPSLYIKQYQPQRINKLTIKGLYCLMLVHKARYNHDFNQYETSVPAQGLPNGGGFTILRFTWNALFEQHEKAHNIWTKSNKNLPLFRYTGCCIKVYRPEYVDLVLKFQTCYPMTSSKLMFTGTQPSIMMMTKGAKLLRCKKNAPQGKPYKKFYLKPPQQMMNKWYFQHTESNTGLLLIQAASASFDQYYTSIHSDSSTIHLQSLNTRIFQNLQFDTKDTYGYHPKKNYYIWASNGSDQLGDLIYLGQSKYYNDGETIGTQPQTTWGSTNFFPCLQTYMANNKKWGNVFHHNHILQSHTHYYFTTTPPLLAFQGTTFNLNTKISEAKKNETPILNTITDHFIIDVRYNPFKDKGYDNNVYILPNFTDNSDDLNPLPDPDLQNPGFPNWLSTFGFTDYLIKLGKKTKIPEHYILIHTSQYFDGPLKYYIFLDSWFIGGNSEDLVGRTEGDNINWYPMIKHQEAALNILVLSGPGTPKLGDIKIAECKCEYKFYFKVGGCSAPVEKVANPATQPTFATPNNILDTNSLQSPEEPIESFLYQFDWRRDQITEKAAQRITKDFSTKKHLFTDAATTGTSVPLHQTLQKEILSSSEEEAQEETLFEQLQRQRIKQKDLRHRIRLLLNQIQQLQ
nr:MAG: ORF1 [TTV-like mini virus]